MQTKLGFSLQNNYALPLEQVIGLLGAAGFDAISLTWSSREQIRSLAGCIRQRGMEVQSLHAPPKGISALWEAEACPLLDTMLECVDLCRELRIPILVIHGWQGHQYTFREEVLYFGHFDNIVACAREKGVSIAFENLEGEEYLEVLMQRYPDVGFCWDSGHDRCYPHQQDFLKNFGHRLIMTHLNDNLGRRSPTPASTDDLHYLPMDGSLDWDACIQRLKDANPKL